MDPIIEFARLHKLAVIEDCAQAHGAKYKGQPVGSFGDAGSFSFCQDKIMSTGGEGGMLVTNNESIWEKAWSYKDHGKDYKTMHAPKASPGYQWVHKSVGTNLRMTEMQAAIGRMQLRKLDEWVIQRQKNAACLTEAFQNLPALRVTKPPENICHGYYKYYTFIRPDKLGEGWHRDRIMQEINSFGIPVSAGSCSEIYMEDAFQKAGLSPASRHRIAQELGATSLMFQVHPTLTGRNMADACRITGDVLENASR
jgi:hypothetical protein